MACCTKACGVQKTTAITSIELATLSKRYRFSPQEILLFRRRFDHMTSDSRHRFVTLHEFRENMGLLGLESTAALADRIFSAMDKTGDGRVSFKDYLDYMDVLIHGTDDEKAEQSYRLITRGTAGPITSDMFSEMMIEIMKLLNTISGNRISASEDLLATLFRQLDIDSNGAIDLQEYKSGWKSNKKIFEWLDFVNSRFAESIHPVELNVKDEESFYLRKIQHLEVELRVCIAMLKGERPVEMDMAKSAKTIFEVSPKDVYLGMISTPSKLNPHMVFAQEMLAHLGDEPPVIQTNQFARSDFLGLRESEESYAIREPNRSAELNVYHEIDGLEVRQDFSFHDEESRNPFQVTTEKPGDQMKIVADRLEALLSITADLKHDSEAKDSVAERSSKAIYNAPGLPEKMKKNSTIHWGDENWNLILNMMLGIQKAVRSTSANFDQMQGVSEKEAMEKVKVNLLSAGSATDVMGLKKLYKFRDYAPTVFEHLKRLRGVTVKDYIRSLGVEKIVQSLLIGNFSSLDGLMTTGKSGSFFFYSDDGKYMIKTLSKSEFMFLRSILHYYYDHIRNYPNTLLTLIYGLHKILFAKNGPKMHRLYFVVMGNLFSSGIEINERYDLKGSTHGRYTSQREDLSVARKDLDFLKNKMKLRFELSQREEFLNQLHKDTEFLSHHHIIDYSLLVGIHHISSPEELKDFPPFHELHSNLRLSADRSCLYQLGVIDTLTLYSTKKKLEHCFRSCFHPGNVVSCIPPTPYAQRFMTFMTRITEVEVR